MELITREIRTKTAYERWMRQYPEDKDGIGRKLQLAGPDITPELVNQIIGNTSWTDIPECEECGAVESTKTIYVGSNDPWKEPGVILCASCVRRAFKLITED